MGLLEKLKPVFSEDLQEWSQIVHDTGGATRALFWYAGSGFDIEPILEWKRGHFPNEVKGAISDDLVLFFSDYWAERVGVLKRLYEELDSDAQLASLIEPRDGHLSLPTELDLIQMVPLTYFGQEERTRIRAQYPGFHSSATPSVVPDDDWHCVLFQVSYRGEVFHLFYWLLENLVLWREIIEPCCLNVEVFCALRVGGKSGSWDYTHSPTRGQLFRAIAASDAAKPGVWIADDCHELRPIWREVGPRGSGSYGEMHFFLTDWEKAKVGLE